MDGLIWGGAVVTLAGVAALMWCVVAMFRARRAGLPEEDLRKRIERLIPVNLGALFLSALGLMLVVVGIFLG